MRPSSHRRLIIFLSIAILALGPNFSVFAAYQASDVLGQTDGNGNPVFTTDNNNDNQPLISPWGIAIDDNDYIYASSEYSSKISVLSPDGDLVDTFGTLGTGNGQLGGDIQSIALDNNGDLYVTDYANHRIVKFNITNPTTRTFDSNIGVGELTSPSGVTVDSSGNIFVSDYAGGFVKKFDSSGALLLTIGAAELDQPGDVALDDDGNIYVSDALDLKTYKYAPDGSPLLNWGSSGVGGGINEYSNPYSVFAYNDHVYVSDYLTNIIYIYDLTGVFVGSFGGTHLAGAADIAVNSSGNLYITSSYFGIEVFTETGTYVSNFVSPTGFNGEGSVVVDYIGHRVFVSNANTLLIWNLDEDNNLLDYHADYVLGGTGNPQGYFNSDMDVFTLDPEHGLLYMNDEDGRIIVFDVRDPGSSDRTLCGYTTNGLANSMLASCVIGQPDFETWDDSLSQAGMNYSESIGIDSEHSRLYVIDSAYSRLMVYDVRDEDHSGINLCGTVTYGLSGNGIPAACVLGQPDFVTSNYAISQKSIYDGEGPIAYDPVMERLYIQDWGENRVIVFDVRDPGSPAQTLCGTSTTGLANNMDASCVLGQPDFVTNGDRGPTSKDFTSYIYGPLIDSVNQRLYVSDDSPRFLVFDVGNISNYMEATAVIGQDDFTSSFSGLTQHSFSGSYALYATSAFDSTNNRLYASNIYGGSRIPIFDFINFTTDSLPNGNPGSHYSRSLETEDSQGTVSYSLYDGSLPHGLTLDSNTGVISGFLPSTRDGVSAFTIQATDDNGAIGNFIDRKEYSLTIANPEASHHSSGQFKFDSSSLGSSSSGRPSILLPTPPTPSTSTPATATSPIFIFKNNHRVYEKDEEIRTLQQYLNTHGYLLTDTGPGSPGNETDRFGALTYAALKKFQSDHGLPSTGFFGPMTRAMIASLGW